MPRYRVSAPQHAITAIRDELASGAVEGVADVSTPRPAPASLIDRRPHGQMEVWELIISLASGVASNAAYDALKAMLAKHPDVRRVDEIDAEGSEASDGDEGS
jgi:hypothetical protein